MGRFLEGSTKPNKLSQRLASGPRALTPGRVREHVLADPPPEELDAVDGDADDWVSSDPGLAKRAKARKAKVRKAKVRHCRSLNRKNARRACLRRI